VPTNFFEARRALEAPQRNQVSFSSY
jgi:hypothetical protein